MKKGLKLFLLLILMVFAFNLSSCQFDGFGDDMEDELENVDIKQLSQIYELAVSQGYTGSYNDWINEVKGESVELRNFGGYIQWKYKGMSDWTNLLPLTDIMGDKGTDGKDGHDGQDGKDGKDGEDGKDGANGLTPYIGENGNWWLGTTDTGVKAEAFGEAGKSAYETFIELHPEYTKGEADWLQDLLDGKLSEINYKYFSVTFDDGCGNSYAVDILNKSPLEMPEAPKKQGHIFTGWFVNGVKWNFDANIVLKDLTLVAGWVKANITPTINISYASADKSNIYFDLYIDDICEVEAIAVYKGGELVATLDNVNDRVFSNLLSNTNYRLEVTYSYDLNDGFGKQYGYLTSYVTTQSTSAPYVYVSNIQTTTNSISLDVNYDDMDSILQLDYIELYKDNELVGKVDDFESIQFENLLSNANYYGKVYYSYDLNDGSGTQQYIYNFYATTVAIRKPVVTLNNLKSTQNSINAEVFISDPDNIDNLISIDLYKGDTIIKSGTDLTLAYTGLKDNTEYKIVVRHSYDINDGNGEITVADEFIVNTHPVYTIMDTNILNTSVILEGDIVFLQVEVDNPSSAVFKKIYVNDVEYDVDPSSTSKNVFVYFTNPEYGNIEFEVNKLVAVLDGIEYTYFTNNNNTAEARVYKKLEILSMEFVDENLQPIDYAFQSTNVYVKLTLDNPEGHSLDSINSNYITNLRKYDDNTYYGLYNNTYYYNYGWMSESISSYTYSNDLFTKTINCELRTTKDFMRLASDSIHTINSLEELRNMGTSYYYYQLTTDINLEGLEWEPIANMNGVFDGNGHVLKNMTIAKTFNNSNVYLGLFKNASGVFKNFSIEEMIIMIESSNSSNYYYNDVYVGGFAAYATNLIFENCHVDNVSSILVKVNNVEDCCVGGFVGYISNDYPKILNSSNRANINSDKYAGAFVGYGFENGTIANSFNTGNITSKYNYGNIFVGSGVSGLNSENCYNTGALNGEYGTYVGSGTYSIGGENANKELNWSDKTYTFNSKGGSYVADVEAAIISNLPTPTKEGYYFAGWYDNEAFEGSPISAPYYNKYDTTLYAKWYKEINDLSNIIENDPISPWVEQDGMIRSTVTTSYTTSTYKIIANQDMRVSFNYSYNGGNMYANAYKYDENGNLYSYSLSSYEVAVDLVAGEYIEFSYYTYYTNDSSSYYGYVYNLHILGLE